MNNKVLIKNILRCAFLLMLQVLLIDRIHLSNQVMPCIYILAILLLPFNTPKWILLVFAFFSGLFVDLFSGTMGLNMSATILIAFVRPMLLKMVSFGHNFDSEEAPNMKNLGVDWFISYAVILILIHHSALFILEVWRLEEIGSTLLRILYSATATFVLVVLGQLLFAFRKA